MKTITFHGLDGSNPLHMLASLGAFRVLCLDDPTARMRWIETAPCIPEIICNHGEMKCRDLILHRLGIRGNAALLARRRRLERTADDCSVQIQSCDFETGSKRAMGQRKTTIGKCRKRIRRIDEATRKAAKRILRDHHEFAMLADCVHQIDRTDFQQFAVAGESDLWKRLASGLAADCLREYKKGEVGLLRTRLSFSNGGSGKALLKDWCSNLLMLRTACSDEPAWLGLSLQKEKVTGLMWEPAEQREYAIRWLDPNNDPTLSVPALNVMALIGLSFFPVVPEGKGGRTTGFDPEESTLVWPLWSAPLSSSNIFALLGMDLAAGNPREWNARGVFGRFQSRIVTANKRNFFAPAKPL